MKNNIIVKIQTIENNQIWDIVDLSKGKKAVGYKWVFTIRSKANGTTKNYKTRLVAKSIPKLMI